MNYRLRAYSLQDIGLRDSQQDCFFPPFREPCQFSEIDRDMVYYDGVPHTDDRLFILCDGMGGPDCGDVASQTVTWELSRSLLKNSSIEGEFDDALIQKAVEEAQTVLTNSKNGSRDMGTTIAILKFHADGATIGHIGDSRVYQFRPGSSSAPDGEDRRGILFCTEDHHLKDRPNILTRAIMANNNTAPKADIDHITDIRKGDIFMLCSDGILENTTDEELCALITNPNYGDAERVQRLLLMCKDHRDNHSATIIRVKDVITPEISSDPDEESTITTLPLGTVLKSENYTYHIEKVLGKGSFGISYLADIHIEMKGALGAIVSNVKVALKEFAMEQKMRREGSELQILSDKDTVNYFLGKFREEATRLALLSHPNIVRVLEAFEANNTVYYAMEYIPDGNLSDYVCMRSGLPERKAISYIRQIGSALSFIHANKMLHLDVKPDNVMRQGENTAKLIDFGIARAIRESSPNPSPKGGMFNTIGTKGFAPPEQVGKGSSVGLTPATDVYGLGATYYKLLVAFTPNEAEDVAKHGLDIRPLLSRYISKKSIEAILAAMQPDMTKRPQTVDEFLDMLPDVASDEDFVAEKPKKESFPWKIILVIAVLIGVLMLVNLLTK